ncbi:DUF6882 domain-containing protein [Corynebacterium striatum]|uniref:DUF6882 domain-containing protein n=1 Tax=Corynebacterium striatum TaxID=43770 RepID=UPI00254E3D69|nr:DUF6882 domain-containing protein [Corynebacterium striatum]MDK8806866.1 hypothetical protein [Corynebacterium striatum]MDK8825922.1 hypothetical protein [Corynebacterium striatum]
MPLPPLPLPTSLEEIYSAGAFVQTGIDASFAEFLGKVTAIEFNFQPSPEGDAETELDQKVQVRFNTARGPQDFPGIRLATVEDEVLTWRATGAAQAPMAEFHAPQPYHESLLTIARFLVGNAPVVRAQQGDHEAIIAVPFTQLPQDARATILAGIERFSGGVDERLALLHLAQAMGLETDSTTRADSESIRLSDGTEVRLTPEGAPEGQRIVVLQGRNYGLLPEQVLSDAHFTAVEHQFFLEARYPNAEAELDLSTGSAVLNTATGSTTVNAHLIAVVDSENLTWAWAEPEYSSTVAAQAAHNLLRFGRDNALPDFVRPQLPLAWARAAHLPQMAMPVLGVWTLLTARLGEKTGLFLASSPTLTLPAPTRDVTDAVLAVKLPTQCDAARARSAYAASRGILL